MTLYFQCCFCSMLFLLFFWFSNKCDPLAWPPGMFGGNVEWNGQNCTTLPLAWLIFVEVVPVQCVFCLILCCLFVAYFDENNYSGDTGSHYWAALQYYIDAAYCYRRSTVVCQSVGLSAGLPVCLSQSWAVQKRLNQSTCCLGCGLEWAKGAMY